MRKEKKPPVSKLTQAKEVITFITAIVNLVLLVLHHLPL